MISAHDCPIVAILIEIADMTMLTPGRSVLECPKWDIFFSKLMFSVLCHSCKCYFENFYTSHEKINDSIRAPSKSRTRQTFLSIFIYFIRSFVT